MDFSHIDAVLLELMKTENELDQKSPRVSLTGSDVTSVSAIDDDEKPLSHAEESAIDDCLNDTEGSLSSVNLNIFDDNSDDLHVQRTKKTRTRRTSERVDISVGGNGTDYDSSSQDELEPYRRWSLTENSLANPISMIGVTRKTNSQDEIIRERKRGIDINKETTRMGFLREQLSKNKERIVRLKRRNSPSINKNDKTHIHSFFSSMADLVSTLPDEYEIRAKQNVNNILEEIVDKFQKWQLNNDPKNPKHGFDFTAVNYRSLQYKIAALQEMN